MNDYKKANELAGQKQAWVIANIGNLQKNLGLYTEAIESLKLALQISPENQYATERLAKAIQSRNDESNKLKDIIKEATRSLLTLRSIKESK